MMDIGPLTENTEMDGAYFALQIVGVVGWLVAIVAARPLAKLPGSVPGGLAVVPAIGLPVLWNTVWPAPEAFTALARLLFGAPLSFLNALGGGAFALRRAKIRDRPLGRSFGFAARLVLGALLAWVPVLLS